jgi:hypothetical protein
LTETQSRAIYRWREEGTNPPFARVDAWLCEFGLLLLDLELFVAERGLCLWATGREPAWFSAVAA